MTIKQLREILAQFPDNMEVYTETSIDEYSPVTNAGTVNFDAEDGQHYEYLLIQ